MSAADVTPEELAGFRKEVGRELGILRGGDGLSRKFACIAERLLEALESCRTERDALRAQLASRPAPVAVEVPERVEQSTLHDPPNSHGNCMSAVFAGLLGIPLDSVPHFADPAKFGDDWRRQVNAWLRPMGLAFIDGIGLSRRDWDDYGTDGLWGMSTGMSPRDPSVSHMIAMKDGVDQWDPHPSQAGLEGEKRYTAFLVALRPWEVARASIQPIDPSRILKDGEREELELLRNLRDEVVLFEWASDPRGDGDPTPHRRAVAEIIGRIDALLSSKEGA